MSQSPAARVDLAALQWALPAAFGMGTSTGGASAAAMAGVEGGGADGPVADRYPLREGWSWAAATAAAADSETPHQDGQAPSAPASRRHSHSQSRHTPLDPSRRGFTQSQADSVLEGGVSVPWAVAGSSGAHAVSQAAATLSDFGDGSLPASLVVGAGAPAGVNGVLASAETAGAAPPAHAAAAPLAELVAAPLRPILPLDARGLLTLALPALRDGPAALPPVQLRRRQDPAAASASDAEPKDGDTADDAASGARGGKSGGGLRAAAAGDRALLAAETAGHSPPDWAVGGSGAIHDVDGGFTHGPRLPMVETDDEAAAVEAVSALGLRFTEKDGETALHRLARERPEVLRSPRVFRAVHHLLAELELSLPARRFVHALFEGVPMDEAAWAGLEAARGDSELMGE